MQPLPATERLNRQHRSASSLPRRLPRRYWRKVASRPCTVRRVGDNVFVERVWRSVKYEQVYLKTYDSVSAARADIADYINWYNTSRRHSSLGDVTPETAYLNDC